MITLLVNSIGENQRVWYRLTLDPACACSGIFRTTMLGRATTTMKISGALPSKDVFFIALHLKGPGSFLHLPSLPPETCVLQSTMAIEWKGRGHQLWTASAWKTHGTSMHRPLAPIWQQGCWEMEGSTWNIWGVPSTSACPGLGLHTPLHVVLLLLFSFWRRKWEQRR